jgi:hypothetical protein
VVARHYTASATADGYGDPASNASQAYPEGVKQLPRSEVGEVGGGGLGAGDVVAGAFLADVVREAAARALELAPEAVPLAKAGDTELASALSTADIELQELIIARLRERYPETPIVAEESTSHSVQRLPVDRAEYFVVDPIDGSYLFLRRSRHYGVQLALVRNDKYVAAAGALPEYNGWLVAPPWAANAFDAEEDGRRAFCSPDISRRSTEIIEACGYSVVAACGLLCMVAPTVWPNTIGVYPGRLSVRGKIGLALALDGGARVFTNDGTLIKTATVSGEIHSLLISNGNVGDGLPLGALRLIT